MDFLNRWKLGIIPVSMFSSTPKTSDSPPEFDQLHDSPPISLHEALHSLQHSRLPSKHESVEQQLHHAGVKQVLWKHRVSFYLDSTHLGRSWELFDTFVNLLLCLVYIYNTTLLDKPRDSAVVVVAKGVEFGLALLLLLQFLPRFVIAVDLTRFVCTNPIVYLTFVSSVAVFLAYFDPSTDGKFMSAGRYAYAYPFRFVRLHLASMACLVPTRTEVLHLSLITRKAIRLVGFLVFLFLTVAAFLHVETHLKESTDPNRKKISFFDAFYYAFVSATSGSSSQIVPDSAFSRLIIVGLIISAAVFVPINLAELLRLISNKSAYDHSFKRSPSQNHVVLCGQFEFISLEAFLKEFFCRDHGEQTINTQVIIVAPSEPSEQMKNLLQEPLYVNRVQYIVGSVLNDRTLEKCRIREANACFVFSTKYVTENATEDDAKTVIRTISLKKYASDLTIHVQVLLSHHKIHFEKLAETIVCVDDLKMGLLSQNCRCPGFTTLVHIITTSITEQAALSLLNSVKPSHQHWVKEYLQGANQEIYQTTVSPSLAGLKFAQISSIIYRNFGAVLFGLIVESSETGDRKICLNPLNYKCKGGEIAFLIGSQDDIAQQVASFDYCEDDVAVQVPSSPPMTAADPERELLIRHRQHSQNNRNHTIAAADTLLRNPGARMLPIEMKELLQRHQSMASSSRSSSYSRRDMEAPSEPLVLSPLANSNGRVRERHISTSSEILLNNSQLLRQQVLDLSDHVVLCVTSTGRTFPENLQYFIAPLRASYIDEADIQDIVIICQNEPDIHQRTMLNSFKRIHLVTGSPMVRTDLEKTAIAKAHKVVILANTFKGKNNAERTADADSLLCALNVEMMAQSPSIFILCEFIHDENMALIGNTASTQIPLSRELKELYGKTMLRTAFMSGHAYSGGMLDALICQNYFNTYMLEILRALLFSGCAASTNDDTPDQREDDDGHVWFFKVPSALAGSLYVDYYTYLAEEHSAIPLALYRKSFSNATRTMSSLLDDVVSGKKKHEPPKKDDSRQFPQSYYVYVNPAPHTRLRANDFCYAISSKKPEQ